MRTKRKKEEIERQINGLKGIRGDLPKIDAFGENNHEKIDAQIDVLNGVDPDDIFEEYDGQYEEEIHEALAWLDGCVKDDLF